MALPHDVAAARVYVVGKDPILTRTLSKLLELDEGITVLGESPSIGTAPIGSLRPDVVVLDETGQPVDLAQTADYLDRISPNTKLCLLEALRSLTVGEILDTVKGFVPPTFIQRSRHLHAVDPSRPEHSALADLSDRELEVVRLVAEGLSNRDISTRLALSDKTVKNHLSHILAKMKLTARTQVAVYALRAGLA